jgi:hypothetical protein
MRLTVLFGMTVLLMAQQLEVASIKPSIYPGNGR